MTRRRWIRRLGMALAAIVILIVVTISIAGCLIIDQPGSSYAGPLGPLTAEEQLSERNLRQHVNALAGNIGIRHYTQLDNYVAAQSYIFTSFKDLGYQPTAANPWGIGPNHIIANVVAELGGTTRGSEILIVGAHFDSIAEGPGANDNGSGVAGTLELARLLARDPQSRTIRFVAFYNEESVYPWGARLYAKSCREKNENIVGMICLETIGYYTDAPNSQHYPSPLSLFYPSTGNFVGFVGSVDYKPFLHDAIWAFRTQTQFPSRGVAAPGFMKDATRSDHAAFWSSGYPAVMITDTANFRYPYYHDARDTPDKIDYERLARVTLGLSRMVRSLAGGATMPAPAESKLSSSSAPAREPSSVPAKAREQGPPPSSNSSAD